MIHFMKNLSLMGIMLFLMANGSGPMSLDGRTVKDSTVKDSTVKDSTVKDSTVKDSTVKDSTARVFN